MHDQDTRHHPLPCRRIRLNQSAKRAGLAPHDLAQARALLRYKDLMLRAVARAGDDAMLAADALRMERDAAHEECARLTAERDGWRALSDERTAELDGALKDCNSAYFRWGQAVGVAYRLVQVICKDAERIATLTAERERARDIAVALEQGLARIVDVVRQRINALEGQTAAGFYVPFIESEMEGLRYALRAFAGHDTPALARVPMDSDRAPEVDA